MAEIKHATDEQRAAGFARSLKVAIAALGSALHTRLELFVTELEEERERLKQTFLLTTLLIVGLGFGFVLLNVFAVALFWKQGWLGAIGGLAAVYLGIGAVAGLRLRKQVLRRTGLFPVTLAELEKDRDRLRSSWHE